MVPDLGGVDAGDLGRHDATTSVAEVVYGKANIGEVGAEMSGKETIRSSMPVVHASASLTATPNRAHRRG